MTQLLMYIVFPAIFAAVVVRLVHPTLVEIALSKEITDKPGMRKLNSTPVPVLGGLGVYIGMILSVGIFSSLVSYEIPSIVFVFITFAFLIGLIDDLNNTIAWKKLLLQISAVCMLMFLGDYKADNLHGLWGVTRVPDWLAYAVTLIAAVGLMNAINMIDGVDGLSSGYGIVASVLCGLYFYFSPMNTGLAIFAFAIAGALIPFFIFNVFSLKYKMFIGDAGALLLGAVFSYFCIEIIQSPASEMCSSGVVAFVAAVFSLPLMDTLRVMTLRMLKGRSPFSADKTHLHHLFIDMGHSHIGTTARVLGLSLVPVIVWFASDRMGVSINAQFYAVLIAGFAITCGVYCYFYLARKKNPDKYEALKERLAASQKVGGPVSKVIRRLVNED